MPHSRYKKVKNKNIKDLTTRVSATSYAKLIQIENKLVLETNGHISAVEIDFDSNTLFSSNLGGGFLLTSNKTKLLMVSLAGNTIEGDIMRFSGTLNILTFKAVGPDAKYVKDTSIERNFDFWNKIEGEWDSFSTNYNEMDYDGNSSLSTPGNKRKNNRAFEPMKTNLSGSKYNVYLGNKKHLGKFHISINTGIAYTGVAPSARSKILSYQSLTKPSIGKNKILQDMNEFFGEGKEVLNDNKIIIDYKASKGSTTVTTKGGDGATGVGGGGGGAGGYG